MTMRFSPNMSVRASGSAGTQVVSAWVSFMCAAEPFGPGWVLKDRKLDEWFVLQTPDKRRELLLYQEGANKGSWQFYYSCSKGFSSSSKRGRAEAEDEVMLGGGLLSPLVSGDASMWHFGADDAPPYPFFLFGYGRRFVEEGCFAAVPTSLVKGDDDPLVFVFCDVSARISQEALCRCGAMEDIVSISHCSGSLCGEAQIGVMPALAYAYNDLSGKLLVLAPGNCGQDTTGREVLSPIVFGRPAGFGTSGGCKGLSSWVCWNPNRRQTGTTFKDKSWVVAGDLVFPWDGVTSPAAV